MSTKSLKQLSRERLDRAITSAFAELRSLRSHRLAFANLLHHVRAKSTLLQITGDGSEQVRVIEALFNISHWHRGFRRWPSSWTSSGGNTHAQILSLATHLFGDYAPPANFALVWFGGDSFSELETRRWFIAYVGGCRFREIPGLPMQMTRNMERILLAAPHHMPLPTAIRRAEVLALGGEPELVEAILATPLAHRFDEGEFWRSAIRFFIRYWDELGPDRIAEYVDQLDAVRHRPLRISTRSGEQFRAPPDPQFSLAGRTPKTVLREIAQRMVAHLPKPTPRPPLPETWAPFELPEFACSDAVGIWRMVELCERSALQREGADMHHCVGGYWQRCATGGSSIWSLQVLTPGNQHNQPGEREASPHAGRRPSTGGFHGREDTQSFVSRCTVEVHPATRRVVQIRGPYNRPLDAGVRGLLERWISQSSLVLAEHAWPHGQSFEPAAPPGQESAKIQASCESLCSA